MNHLGPTLRRTRRRERPGWRLLLALSVSLAINLLALTQLDAGWLKAMQRREVRPVALAPLAAADWESNRAVRDGSRPPPRPPEPPVAPPEQPAPHGQLVDVANQPEDPANRPPPRDTRFISERDRFVEKETRARQSKAPGEKTAPVRSSPQTVAVAGPVGPAGRAAEAKAGPKGAGAANDGKAAEPSKAVAAASVPEDRPGDLLAAKPEVAPVPAPGGGADAHSGVGNGDPRLAIPPSTLARLAGGASMDHLKDVDEGEGTYLNTREWKYATYFNRIKDAVGSAWVLELERDVYRRDPLGSLTANRDRRTLVGVVFDDKGGVRDLSVIISSNVDFIDRAALEAFRKAQPFPNPPPGLADSAGEIKWALGFTINGSQTGLRIYRSAGP